VFYLRSHEIGTFARITVQIPDDLTQRLNSEGGTCRRHAARRRKWLGMSAVTRAFLKSEIEETKAGILLAGYSI
jgi:hypothetical protein